MKLLLTTIFLLLSTIAQAKDIKLIVPQAPGGAADRIARLIQTELSDNNHNVIVEYKPGAGGAIAYDYLAATKNETVLVIASNGLTTLPLLNPNINYDVNKEFTLVKYVGIDPMLLMVKNNTGIKNYKDFVEVAKTQSMPYGSAGIASAGHIAGAIIAGNNKNFIHIPYKGNALVLADLLSGVIKWEMDSDLIQSSYIADGMTRPIAVYSKSRVKKYPNVPTVKELGINDYGQYRWFVLISNNFANPTIIAHIKSKLNTVDFQKKVEDFGLDTSAPKHVDQFFLTETVQTHRMLQHINLK